MKRKFLKLSEKRDSNDFESDYFSFSRKIGSQINISQWNPFLKIESNFNEHNASHSNLTSTGLVSSGLSSNGLSSTSGLRKIGDTWIGDKNLMDQIFDPSIPKSIRLVQTLSSFYAISSRINDIHLLITQNYPNVPSNYYRELIDLIKQINVYISFSKEEVFIDNSFNPSYSNNSNNQNLINSNLNNESIHSVHNVQQNIQNSDTGAITFEDLWMYILTRMEEKIMKIIKSYLIYSFQKLILQFFESMDQPGTKRGLLDVLTEISQWNRLVKSFWEKLYNISSSSLFHRFLSLQISVLEICLRTCDARFYDSAKKGKIPRRGLHKLSFSSNTIERKFSLTSSLGTSQGASLTPTLSKLPSGRTTESERKKKLEPATPKSSRLIDKIYCQSFTLDPMFESDSIINYDGASQRKISLRETFSCEINHRNIPLDAFQSQLDYMISEEYEILKSIIVLIEGANDLYIPMYDVNVNSDKSHSYYKHKRKSFGQSLIPSLSQNQLTTPNDSQLFKEVDVIDTKKVNELIQNLSHDTLLKTNSGTDIIQKLSQLEEEFELCLIPFVGNSFNQLLDYSSQYSSILFRRLSFSCGIPSVLGMSIFTGSGTGNLFNQPQTIQSVQNDQISDIYTQIKYTGFIQREFIKILPSISRLEQKEDFSNVSRFREIQRNGQLNCQTQLFTQIFNFLDSLKSLKDKKLTESYAIFGAFGSDPHFQSKSAFNLQDTLNLHILKTLQYLSNLVFKHVSKFDKTPTPRLQSMCVLHSELTHILVLVDEFHPKSTNRTIQLKGEYSSDETSKILRWIKKLQDLHMRLTKKLSSEIMEISNEFWISNLKKKSKKIGFGSICCYGSSNSNTVDVSQYQIQRAIESILLPAFESIASSHTISRRILLEIFVSDMLASLLHIVRKQGEMVQKKKSQLWNLMKQFRNDVFYIHNWIMQSVLLSNAEKQFISGAKIFEHIDGILLELDEKINSSYKTTKYSVKSNNQEHHKFSRKKSTIYPVNEVNTSKPHPLVRKTSILWIQRLDNQEDETPNMIWPKLETKIDSNEWQGLLSSLK